MPTLTVASDPIQVTKPFLPPLEKLTPYLEAIWDRAHLTNHGPLVQDLERQLADKLGVPYVFLVSSGTMALQLGVHALGLSGEVIVTPFSYVATVSSLVWEGLTPVFTDIEPDMLTLDPAKIEAAITPRTTGIVATHIYGNPCHVQAIESIAQKHQLKVLYDAAHGFGVKYLGQSLLGFGDISIASFHATKLFHTVEGGALITHQTALAHKIETMRQFGYDNGEIAGVGINGKMSELHAAVGLCMLPEVDAIRTRYLEHCKHYQEAFEDVAGLETIRLRPGTEWNGTFFPVFFETESQLLKTQAALNADRIYPRRYFNPSLSRLPYVPPAVTPIADDVSKRVLCLPLYPALEDWQVRAIADKVVASLT